MEQKFRQQAGNATGTALYAAAVGCMGRELFREHAGSM
jgi:hypothetical protein